MDVRAITCRVLPLDNCTISIKIMELECWVRIGTATGNYIQSAVGFRARTTCYIKKKNKRTNREILLSQICHFYVVLRNIIKNSSNCRRNWERGKCKFNIYRNPDKRIVCILPKRICLYCKISYLVGALYWIQGNNKVIELLSFNSIAITACFGYILPSSDAAKC